MKEEKMFYGWKIVVIAIISLNVDSSGHMLQPLP